MAVKAVLDTNVWVSAILNPRGAPARLLTAFAEGSFRAVVSAPLLGELAEMLSRPRLRDKYGITDNDLLELLSLIEERAEHALLRGDIHICRDPDDDMVIETAIRGQASHLVSRDDDLKFDTEVARILAGHDVTVVTVARFLALLAPPASP